MQFGIKNFYRPTKIKSLKELEPEFVPKWFKYCLRAVLVCFASLVLIAVAQLLEVEVLFVIGALGVLLGMISFFLIFLIPALLSFGGFFWPWLGKKSALLDKWLERDLDWGFRK